MKLQFQNQTSILKWSFDFKIEKSNFGFKTADFVNMCASSSSSFHEEIWAVFSTGVLFYKLAGMNFWSQFLKSTFGGVWSFPKGFSVILSTTWANVFRGTAVFGNNSLQNISLLYHHDTYTVLFYVLHIFIFLYVLR